MLCEQIARLDLRVQALAKAVAPCRRLMTVPGVGPITALAYVTAIDDPGRFRKGRSVGAYLGLTPRRYQSGEVDRAGRISKCGDGLVRTLLFLSVHRRKGQPTSLRRALPGVLGPDRLGAGLQFLRLLAASSLTQ